jgi:hypothetical protein
LPRRLLPTLVCQLPALSPAICWGIWRRAANIRPQVNSAVAKDGVPACWPEHSSTPARVQAPTSMWGVTLLWLISLSLSSRSSSGAWIRVRSRISTRASVSRSRSASASVS